MSTMTRAQIAEKLQLTLDQVRHAERTGLKKMARREHGLHVFTEVHQVFEYHYNHRDYVPMPWRTTDE